VRSDKSVAARNCNWIWEEPQQSLELVFVEKEFPFIGKEFFPDEVYYHLVPIPHPQGSYPFPHGFVCMMVLSDE